MAEGWAKAIRPHDLEVRSAGVSPHGLDPRAVKAMAEAGVDISGQEAKDLSLFLDMDWDYVVTLCDNANANCPFFPGRVKRVHRGFDDPPLLATGAKSEEEAMGHYRRVRDEIKELVSGIPARLED